MKSKLLLLLAVPLLAGCGGSKKPADTTEETGSVREFGSLVTRIVGTAQAPVTSYGGTAGSLYEGSAKGAVVTGVAGASITELTHRDARPASDGDLRTVLTRDGDLFVANGALERLVRLTDTSAVESDAAVSADGQRIVFVRNGDLFLINADGSGLTQLTSGAAADSAPDISPNGQLVVFVRTVGSGPANLFTIHADGTALTQITSRAAGQTFRDDDPAFSPSGARVAFVRRGLGPILPDQIVATMPVAGGAPTTVVSTAVDNHSLESPAFSPDGARLAYILTTPDLQNSTDVYTAFDSHVMVVDAGGTNVRELDSIKTLFSTFNVFQNPVWTADGQRVAFTGVHGFRSTDPNDPLTNQSSEVRTVRILDRQASLLGSGSQRLFRLEDLTGALARTSVPILGPGGLLGSGAAGFFVAQANVPTNTGVAEPDLASALVFDTVKQDLPTRSTARVLRQTEDNVGAAVLVFHIQAGAALKSIAYAQFQGSGPGAPAPEVVTLALSDLTTSALVAFNSTTGKVASILPYTANRSVSGGLPTLTREGGALVVRGRFLGVFDATGRNVAPQGAGVVKLDAKTGAVL